MSFGNNILNTTGTVTVDRGGTGITSTPSNGQTLIGNGTNYTAATLTAGSNITITNSSGAIQIAAVGSAPSQCSFYAYVSTDITNATGAGTVYSIASNWTSDFDLSSNFNSSNGQFTAPFKGIYKFLGAIQVGNLTSAMTSCTYVLKQTGSTTRNIYVAAFNPYYGRDGTSNTIGIPFNAIMDLAANDIVVLNVTISKGAGNTATIIGDGSSQRPTFFSGTLVKKT